MSLRKAKIERLDSATLARRAVLSKMEKMTRQELFQLAVRAGIYTSDGKLTPPYRAEDSVGRQPVARPRTPLRSSKARSG